MKEKRVVIFSSIGIAAVVITAVVLTAAFLPTSTTSGNTSSIGAGSTTDDSPPTFHDTEMTNFLIAYPLFTEPETANKVGINDYPWLGKLIENGEAIISFEELKEYTNNYYNKSPDFAILMEDGTTKYYNVNYSRLNLIPNTPYVKAYWTGDFGGKPFKEIELKDHPWLKKVVEEKSNWVPLEDANDVNAFNQLRESAKVKNFKVEHDDGKVELYELRYISPAQDMVN